MKRSLFGALSFFLLSMFVGVPVVVAQSHEVANIPFSFQVDTKSMAAGRYNVRSISEQVDLITNDDTQAAAFLAKAMRVQAKNVPHAMLVFHKCGNHYFLSQIWDGRSDTGVQLNESKREKELSLAGNRFSHQPEIVMVAMK
jgi:hypothetical protein